MKKILAAILALVLITTACSPAPVKTPAESSSDTLFADDFTDPNSGWDRYQDETGVTDYSNIGYLIYIKTANVIKWANPSEKFQNDVLIEVDATKKEGPDDNAFGLICRYQDMDNFYYFYISSDGYAGIGIDNNGTKTIISDSSGNLVSDSNINQGAAVNHIQADCVGSSLSLSVNGVKIATASDSTFSGGDVGLIARSFATGGVDIQFNNFYVYKP